MDIYIRALHDALPISKDGFWLERIQALLAGLGDPQLRYPSLHVVGTNGKSTVTRTIEALLAGEGLSVDLPFVPTDRKSTRLNSSHGSISYAVFCLKKK